MNEGKFVLDATKFNDTCVIGYDKLGDFVHDITKTCQKTSRVDDYSEFFQNESEYEKNSRNKSNLKLLIAASIVAEIRKDVFTKTGFTCSAGIAHNKILAKLCAGNI